MKKVLISLSIIGFLILSSVGGYFLAKKFNYFLSNEEVWQKMVEETIKLDSFELEMTGDTNGEMSGGLVLKYLKADDANPFALNLVVNTDMEGESFELLSFLLKNQKYFLKIGNFPLFAFFGLDPFLDQWFFAENGDFEKIKTVLTEETPMEGAEDMLSSMFLSYEEDIEEMNESVAELKEMMTFSVDYLLNKDLFVINEKLADTELEGKTILNYSLILDKVVLKNFVLEMNLKISEMTGEEAPSSEEAMLEFDEQLASFEFSNILLSIEKDSFRLRNLSFGFAMGEETANLSFAFSNLNNISFDSIEEPTAINIVDWVKYYMQETTRAAYYQTRETMVLQLQSILSQQCEQFTAEELLEEGEEVENKVLKIDGSNLSLISKLEKFDNFDLSIINDPEIPEGEVLEACSPDSINLCDFAFGNPGDKGAAFNFNMTYVDPCNYWVNFYSESDLKGYLNHEEVMFPKYENRTYEQYFNGELPSMELYNGEKEGFGMGFDMSFDMGMTDEDSGFVELEPYDSDTIVIDMSDSDVVVTRPEEEVYANDDEKRIADMKKIKSEMRDLCFFDDKVKLDVDINSLGYVPLSKAVDSTFGTFSDKNDPSGASEACSNTATDNCEYAFVDPNGTGEFLAINANDDGIVVLDSCDYQINFYLDEGGASYLTENGIFQANGTEIQ